MKQNRTRAITETLKWEGGYSNHPSDPGGATNWGITIADAKKYWKPNATAEDVKKMPKSVAVNIYEQKYWVNSYFNCDNLNSGVDLATFDFGVNSGPSRAKRYLMNAIGGSDVETINKLCDDRLEFLKGLKTWGVFGKGWGRRVEGIRAMSLQMAAEATEEPVQSTEVLPPTPNTSRIGEKGKELWDNWSWIPFKSWNWAAITRQLTIMGTGLLAFFQDLWWKHPYLIVGVISLVSAYAIWRAMGSPKFWNLWNIKNMFKGI